MHTQLTVTRYPSKPYPIGVTAAQPSVVGHESVTHGVVNVAVYAPGLDAVDIVFTVPDFPVGVAPTVADLTRVALPALSGHVHHGGVEGLGYGSLYAFIDRRAALTGPEGIHQVAHVLLDPYANAVSERAGTYWSVYVDPSFDWGDGLRPATAMRDTVIYEAHVVGQTKLHPEIPEELRGTYAGLAHPVMIDYFHRLGVTAIELLPVHHHTDEQHLRAHGLTNYWGYNTVNFFSPHPSYATKAAQALGPAAIADEFKGMVKLLHEAGLEVLLDVVYNHTAEEGPGGPEFSWRGLGDQHYYRHTLDGSYLDTTGCGNTLDFSQPAVVRLALDSLRRWVTEFGVDGFRFDLAVSLGRNEHHTFTHRHPFLVALAADPVLAEVKMISEPWDVAMGGWQTGQFPEPFSDWNDQFRDTVRDFWVAGRGALDAGERAGNLGRLADVISGSQNLFADSGRSALASVNYATAHDGFTLADLVAYNRKHNEANGEDNRDGTDNNRSYNHGVEGPTDSVKVMRARAQTSRNVLATLMFSLGVPMLCAGDELGRSQQGNNNAYCQDNEISWTDWPRLLKDPQAQELFDTTRRLITLRQRFLADQPYTYPSRNSGHLLWFNSGGQPMNQDDWENPANRLVQVLIGVPNGTTTGLLVINGGLERERFTTPSAEPGQESLLGHLNGHDFTLAMSTDARGSQRHGARVKPGGVDMISPFSISAYSIGGMAHHTA